MHKPHCPSSLRYRLARVVPLLSTLVLVGARPLRVPDPARRVLPPPQLVGVGIIHTRHMQRGVFEVDAYQADLEVTWQGHPVRLVLGLGGDFGLILMGQKMATLFGETPPDTVLDSLPAALRFARQVPTPLPQVIGLVGNRFLAHYDLVLDGAAGQVRLYTRGPGLPPDGRATQCTPIRPMPEANEAFQIRADGHPLTAIFETRADYTKMNIVAAKAIGLTQHAPQVHPKPANVWEQQDAFGHRIKYQARDISLTLGTQPFTAGPILLFPKLGVDQGAQSVPPTILLNLSNIPHQRWVLSNSTHQVCLGSSPGPTGHES
jgi:hypothetical protein